MKTCSVCRETRPLEDFSPNAHMRDGRLSLCKPCNAAKARLRRGSKPRPTWLAGFNGRIAPPDARGCTLWLGARAGSSPSDPYGVAWNGERLEMAHRIAYRLARGAIPDGLQLDHLCRVRLCVNPEHLEPVTASENVRRGLVPQLLRDRHRRLREAKNP